MHGVDELKRALREHPRGREGVVAVYLFGSQLRGRMHGLSDVDVAVLVDPQKRAL